LSKDTGFQGYEPAVRKTCQGKKKPPRGKLTEAEKRTNRKLAQIRSRWNMISQGEALRIVKDVLRNTKDGVSDPSWSGLWIAQRSSENPKRRLKN